MDLLKCKLLLFISLCFLLLGNASYGENQHLYPIKKNDKWGYIDKTGKIIIKPQYDLATDFVDGMAVINLGGKKSHSRPFNWPEGKWDGKWGYIDKTGKMAIRPQYNSANDFCDGVALIRFENAWGYIDKTGKPLVQVADNNPNNLGNPFNFSEGYAAVANTAIFRHWKWGYIDKAGKIVIGFKFGGGTDFSEGLAPVWIGEKDAQKWGYINKTGEFVIEPKYDWAYPFNEGLAAVSVNGYRGVINKHGNYIIKPAYSRGSDRFSEGLILVGDDTRFYILDKTGKEIAKLPNAITDVEKFKEGIAPAAIWKKDDDGREYKKWGYVNKRGEFVVEPKFDEVWNFSGGLGRIRLNGEFGYIDKHGKYIWQPQE